MTQTFTPRIKALSLFANVGVAEAYLSELGIDVVIANELLPKRAQFYRHLYPSVNMIDGDISRNDIFSSVLSSAEKEGIDFLIATPPCQGMSCAGRKNPEDPRNHLIFYAVEIILNLLPKYVLLENVPRQAKTHISIDGESISIPEYIESSLSKYYNFNNKRIVNSMDYGIPQSRQRYFYLLVRKDIGIVWEFPPKEEKIITLKEAIGHLPSLDPCLREDNMRFIFPEYEKKKQEGLRISKWHTPPLQSWKYVEWLMHTPTGKSAFENKIFYPQINGRRIKGGPQTYKRMAWDKPATTVMSNSNIISGFSTVHPGREVIKSNIEGERVYSDPRVLTIYELLIVSSLPLDWDIPEWASDNLIREVIGEGIPPLLIKRAVSSLIVSLLEIH